MLISSQRTLRSREWPSRLTRICLSPPSPSQKSGEALEKPAGKRRDQLETWFSGPEGPQTLFAGRVLPFDEKADPIWARLMADGKAKGRPRGALDTIIAAVAEANDCVVVTENEKDFAEIEILNPLRLAT